MTDSLRRLSLAFLAAFTIVALALGYWGLIRRDELMARQDNPRLVLEEQSIRRGQILDRNGMILAETQIEPSTGLGTRYYPSPAAAPVVGYYSLRYGVGGIEAEYDAALRGDVFLTPMQRLINHTLHRPQEGGDVRLTIDLAIQRYVAQAIEGRKGAVVVLAVPQGEVLAIGSQPSFDPNNLDDMWSSLTNDPDAPLINRATQSLYQPGTILQSIILGVALNTGLATPTEGWNGDLTVRLDQGGLPCAGQSSNPVDSLRAAFLWACPRPFQALGQRAGAHYLDAALADFGLLEAPKFELPTGAVAPDVAPAQANLALTAIGQSDLTVSVLQMALVAAAFADHGQMPAARLVQAIRAPAGDWEAVPARGYPRGTISRASADAVADLMEEAVTSGAAQAAQWPGHRVFGHAGLSLSGTALSYNAWFIGYVYRANGDAVVVAILLEDTSNADVAAQIGGDVLRLAVETPTQ